MKLALVLVLAVGCGDSSAPTCTIPGTGPGVDPSGALCDRLSSYRLFADIATQTPAEGVIPYDLNTPLFSDYTTKQRFLYLPPGATIGWRDTQALDLPVGAVLIKTFSYLTDRRDPSLGSNHIETRLLIHGDAGWSGSSYTYDGDQTDAQLAVAGEAVDTAWIHDDGSLRDNHYLVPNKNQCKNCHADSGAGENALGPKARHLNRPGPAGSGIANQLQHLVDLGALVGAPPAAIWPKAPVATDPSTGTVDERARAWLDINCAHCHNPLGAARTSGLFLDLAETNGPTFGVCKPPIAAGRGSGGRAFSIVPGQPDASIMTFRIESTVAEVKMPELGRNLVDESGAALIRQWITEMPGSCN